MHFVREIWLRHGKCAAARRWIYFISLDAPASNITMPGWVLFHILRQQNISPGPRKLNIRYRHPLIERHVGRSHDMDRPYCIHSMPPAAVRAELSLAFSSGIGYNSAVQKEKIHLTTME